jgi:thymidylate synthase (FAD)
MKILTWPSVYLLGRQTVQESELDRFLLDHGVTWESDSEVAAEVLTETAGRTCYMSFAKPRPGGNAAYLGHIRESGHGSVLEHAVWNLLITGISRSLSHELVRHRAGFAYSQLSQRYVDESTAEYICPDIIRGDPELYSIWYEAVRQVHGAYVELAERLAKKLEPDIRTCPKCGGDGDGPCGTVCEICDAGGQVCVSGIRDNTERRKAARQASRSVLPNATETKIFVTLNGRAARHFLEQRGSRHAEPEIRKLANVMFDILLKESPNLFSDYTKIPLPDDTFEISTPYRKV